MAYIGRGLDKISNVEVLDNITFDGSSTSFTLQKGSVNFTPSSANNILVSIDGVVQAGNFTCSGSTIDFGVAVSASSTCNFIIHYGVGVITIPSDNSITAAKIPSGTISNSHLATTSINSQTAEATIAGDDEVLIYDTSASALRKMTRANFVSGIGGTNTPAFEATLGSNQAPSNDVNTLVVFDSERFDTASAYNTSDGKFTPQTAGKYFVYGSIAGQSTVDSGNLYKTTAMIYFNGSETRTEDIIGESGSSVQNARMSVSTYGIFTFNGSSDYVQLYANIQTHTGGNVEIQSNLIRTYFGAYKIIE